MVVFYVWNWWTNHPQGFSVINTNITELLGSKGLCHPPAIWYGSWSGDLPSRYHIALSGNRWCLECSIRPTIETSHRRTLWRESKSFAALLPVSSRYETLRRRSPPRDKASTTSFFCSHRTQNLHAWVNVKKFMVFRVRRKYHRCINALVRTSSAAPLPCGTGAHVCWRCGCREYYTIAVSYTHLTLPTKRIV